MRIYAIALSITRQDGTTALLQLALHDSPLTEAEAKDYALRESQKRWPIVAKRSQSVMLIESAAPKAKPAPVDPVRQGSPFDVFGQMFGQ